MSGYEYDELEDFDDIDDEGYGEQEEEEEEDEYEDIFSSSEDEEMNDEVDFVIAWVDGSDPKWKAEKDRFDKRPSKGSAEVRFRDWNNLRYWFRGVEKFAPWVRKIHFVTWGHLPKWLNVDAPKLNIVNHREYIPEKYLPTFNSHTIELNLHRIDGLAENFVYFNDDMFLTGPVEKEDFFFEGQPCDVYGLNCLYFAEDSIAHINGSNVAEINKHFTSSRDVLRSNLKKWYSPQNGLKRNIKTFMLSQWEWFPGFHYDHLPTNFKKQTFEEVWRECGKTLDRTCMCRFRSDLNVNQWLMKYWQLCNGISIPKKSIGKCFHLKDEDIRPMCDDIIKQTYKMICVNDTALTTDFEIKCKMLRKSFYSILPEKSSFEM